MYVHTSILYKYYKAVEFVLLNTNLRKYWFVFKKYF